MSGLRDVQFRGSDGVPLRARSGGERGAFPLFFIHGWLADSLVWDAVATELARDFRLVAIDLRGSGGSSRAAGPCTLETYAADCVALVRSESLDPAIVIGHSMGAAVAMRFAIEEPDAVEGLVLVNPTPPSGVRFKPHVDEMFRSLPGERDRILAWIRGLTTEPMHPETERDLLRSALAVRSDAAIEAYEAWSGADFADDAATIEQPVLVLAGAADRALPASMLQREIVDPLADGILEVIESAGHYLPLERAPLIAARIRRFASDL